MEDFQGHVIHSHDYRNPEMFRDKVVVCLGAGASGQDIAVEVSSVASMVRCSFAEIGIPLSVSRNRLDLFNKDGEKNILSITQSYAYYHKSVKT
jgi:hypothetical protein